jgi:type I restriction enzyme, S subunit
MIADLKPYREYKESGSGWVAAVPSHWEVRNLRTLIRARNERNRADLPLLSVAREKGVFVRSLTDVDENHNVIPEDLSNYKTARAGNLVINKMKAWQGSMGIAPCDGIVSPAYFVFDFGITNRAFGQALLRSRVYVAHFAQASDGVRVGQWDLTIAGMRQIPVLIPPPDEQAAIVRFLEWANGRLEQAIRAKRKVIALLTEQKQAIIHRAVTRGFDPSVSLKASGIPWLGDIPQHWEVRRLKFTVDHYGPGIQMGPFGSSLTELQSADTGFKLFGQENTISGDFTRGGRWITKEQFGELRKYELIPGDIVLTRKGSIGKARLVPTGIPKGIADSDTIRVRLARQKVEPMFIVEVLHSSTYVQRQLEATRRGAVLGGLNTATVGNVALVLPPRLEQLTLLADLRELTKGFATGIGRVEREIELLREYRTRLISDVVTGKLDVGDAVARLPEDAVPDIAEDAAAWIDETEPSAEEVAA